VIKINNTNLLLAKQTYRDLYLYTFFFSFLANIILNVLLDATVFLFLY